MDKNELGRKGEDMAVEFLRKMGYQTLCRNWRYHPKEIDIIARQSDTLVIVEVKSRTYDFVENPQEAVTKKKQRYLIHAADAYIREHDLDLPVRFDVITVIFGLEDVEIEHIDGAFYPTLR